jgi:hypothetical protein
MVQTSQETSRLHDNAGRIPEGQQNGQMVHVVDVS